MKILAVGGGSGGHVTPIAAVLKVLLEDDPASDIRVWCDTTFKVQAKQTIAVVNSDIRVDVIASGKLRRYNTLSWWQHLIRLRTIVLPNIRDGFLIGFGTLQSFVKLVVWRPDVIFCKGGYVCLPVGVAAQVLGIPVVLHDSDAHPGLTNRILSRWATTIGTGAPLDNYSYPPSKTRYVGIPIDERFKRCSVTKRHEFTKQLGFSGTRPLIVITGGGLGARSVNDAIRAILDELLMACDVLLLSGTKQFESLQKQTTHYETAHFQLKAYVTDTIVETFAAADLVVARAGATTLLELAALAKPTIIIPNPYLTGAHQLKNAAVYARKSAAVIVDEKSLVTPHELLDTINSLILNPKELARMGDAIHVFAKPHAAKDMASMIQSAAKTST